MLLVWPLFAAWYFKKRTLRTSIKETLALSVFWLALAMAVDFVGFVLIKNPLSMTAREFYVDYQPWISLIYLSIFASPWIRLAIAKMRMGA